MRVVIVGGTGFIGGKLAGVLRERGHDVLQAGRSTGLDVVTGEGVAAAVAGARVVVDLTTTRDFTPGAAAAFFTAAGRNLLAAEAEAGVAHHLPLSIVGVDRMADSDYMRGKLAQEEQIRAGRVPYTILRATQFFEFLPAIAEGAADGDTVRLPGVAFQPIAGDDVAALVADAVEAEPTGGTVDVAGPDRAPLHELVARSLAARGDRRKVIADPAAGYFGARVVADEMVPAGPARLGATHLTDWLAR